MSAAPTLGPFSMSPPAKPTPDAQAGGDIAILDAAGNIIAECFVWVNEAQTVDALAHARLIVAAPKMLEELQWIAAHASSREIREIAARTVALVTGDAA